MHLKKGVVAGSIVLAFFMMVGADVIIPNTHVVERCVTIANGEEFPDIALVGAYTGPSGQTIMRYLVKTDSCLTKGTYKLNRFYLFWVAKSYLESQGLENLPLADYLSAIPAKKRSTGEVDVPMGIIPVQIEPLGATVPDSDPLVSERLLYKLTTNSGSSGINVYLAEKVTVDKDGSEKRETFDPVGITSRPESARAASLNMNARLGRGYLTFSPGFSGTVSADLIDCHGRPAVRFSRECRSGCTYLVQTTNLSAGIYWLRVKSGNAAANSRLDMFE
ncbi:MAG: hypothetical protein JW913_20205 [Chitinispirillaceae bacterium]|nr:hypothetical protein [Chitinispirillaceae bacterium]